MTVHKGVRFYVGAALVWLGTRVWEREMRERFQRVLDTGDPQAYVTMREADGDAAE